MKKKSTFLFLLLTFLFSKFQTSNAQVVLYNHAFTTTTLPNGITSDGVISPTKAADGVCSQGMIQVNSGGFFQASIASCNVFRLHMKSTSSSARNVAIKYKKDGDAAFTTVVPNISVATASIFTLSTTYPELVSNIPIIIRVEPLNGNIQIHDLYAEANANLSSSAEILAFKVTNQLGAEIINTANGTIQVKIPLNSNVTNITPQLVQVSPQATISPSNTSAQNFTNPVLYTVTAQNGSIKNWTVTLVPTASSEKEIIDFKLSSVQIGSAVINSIAGTVNVQVPNGTDLTNIAPQFITLSNGATISPSVSSTQNFSSPVTYTVTAQDNTTKQFSVNVSFVNPLTIFTNYEAENAIFTGKVESNNTGFNGTGFVNFLDSGENEIVFTVCQQQAGNYTANFRYALGNDTYRKGKLFVNDTYHSLLDFNRTLNFTTWAEQSASVQLIAGINTLKLTWDTTDAPNIDRLSINGLACNTYTLSTQTINGGTVSISPSRSNNTYFENEVVRIQAQGSVNKIFTNWSGDVTGNSNPVSLLMNANKFVTANFNTIPTYTLNTNIVGLGSISLQPSGGEYAENTVVTVTAVPIAGSTFNNWSGNLTGTTISQTITMNSNKSVTASFNSSNNIDFEKVVGFASISGDGFTGATKGGQCSADTVFINGPTEFNKLCELLYDRQRAYKNNVTTNGVKKAPLVILLKEGVYDGTQTLSANGAKVFGNSMLDIPEQGDLSFVGQSNVVFKIGINVKRSYNLLIRNITFFDYYDDGINIGGEETHHIWIDHCTVGHPSLRPVNTEHPDGGIDVKEGSSFVTISWCLIRNSWKTSLVGHSDNNGSIDNGRLKVTYANNYFFNTNSRNPRVRFGEVHVLNNLFDKVQLYGAVAANNALVFCENNFFLNTVWPMYADRSVADFKAVYGNNSDNVFTSKTGNYPSRGLKHRGNAYDDSGLPIITAQVNAAMLNPGNRSIKFDELNVNTVFEPTAYYNYTAMSANDVRSIVPVLAGADKVSFSSCSVLPLQFASFTAIPKNATHLLEFITINEINTSKFLIEKSLNGSVFSVIGSIDAKNVSGIHTYKFENNSTDKLVYYRIKQVDKDGAFMYSKVIVVKANNFLDVKVYPNPAHNYINIQHNASPTSTTIKVVNAHGKEVNLLTVAPYTTNTFLNISQLPQGTYWLIIQNSSLAQKTFFIKNK